MKYLILVILTLIVHPIMGQDFNSYKYVVVDNQYDFQSESNQYLLNDLAVFELNKRGFIAFKNDKIQPNDKNLGVCNTLQMKAEAGGTLDRRITLSFEDCEGNVLFTTQQGIGREKDDKKAYYKAMREAMKSLDDMDYQYQPREKENATAMVNRVDALKKEPKTTAVAFSVPESTVNQRVVRTSVPVPNDSMVNASSPAVYEYKAPNTPYRLERKGENFVIWNQDQVIGNLKKSGGGCYLAIASDFIGIGYFKEGVMMIDANQKGEEVQLSFIKN